MDLLDGLFPSAVATAMADPRIDHAGLYPVEQAYVARAVAARQREFAAGRFCAREALRALGVAAMAIPAGADRAPIWPVGVVGSISHCATLAAAAVGLTAHGVIAIGIDLETATPLDNDLCETVCTARERAVLAGMDAGDRGLFAKAMFTAKEAVFKCLYPMTGTILDFQDIEVDLDLAGETFTAWTADRSASLSVTTAPLSGRVRDRGGYLISVMTMMSAETGSRA